MSRWVLVLLACSSGAQARVYSPRIVSSHQADAYSLRTFAQFPRWRDLRGDARAWEIYKYLVDTRTGLFHMNEVLEGNDVLSEYRTVRDPIKIINVYGYAYCAILGPVMAGVWEGMGAGKARTLTLPAWHHVASEVFYDGGWHYLDLDVRAAFRRPDGTLASMADARSDGSLWVDRGPLFFPNDALGKAREIYQRTEVHHYHGFHSLGHTMDYVLRQGEKLTRWWKPQGGRWHHSASYNRQEWLRELIEKEPRGPKPNHRHFTVHDYANGRFVYEPNLTNRSSDFADGVYESSNVRSGPRGLTLADPGEGYAVFEIRSPYVIVPIVGELETTEDDREASVVAIDTEEVRLSTSLDNGVTWDPLEIDSGPVEVDLTSRVSGTYGYLLKISFRGAPGRSVVRTLKVTTWVQVAPAALPSLRAGTNHFDYRVGDHHGLESRAVTFSSNGSDPKDFLKYVVLPPEDYDPSRTTQRVRGTFVVRAPAPPRATVAWFTAGASFRTHLHAAARNTRNSIAYAVDAPENFREIYRADVPRDTEHWHYNADREVKLDSPAREIFVRYVGDPALNNFRVHLHSVENELRPRSPVTVTHVWSERGDRQSHSVRLDRPGPYEIEVATEPENISLEISVPSGERP